MFNVRWLIGPAGNNMNRDQGLALASSDNGVADPDELLRNGANFGLNGVNWALNLQ